MPGAQRAVDGLGQVSADRLILPSFSSCAVRQMACCIIPHSSCNGNSLFLALGCGLEEPRGRVLVAGFVLALAAGLFFWWLKLGRAFSVPICAATAAWLPPLAAVAAAMGRRPGGVTTRRGWAAFGLGATAGPLLATIGEFVLPLAVLLLVSAVTGGLPRAGKELPNALRTESLSPELMRPMLVAIVVAVTVVGPIVEELAKSLPLLPLLKWVTTRRDAFFLGALAGAAFAAVENMGYAAAAGSDWVPVLAVRSVGAAVHPLGAGLTAVAWWGVRRGEPRAAATGGATTGWRWGFMPSGMEQS